jgi:hypothetical protein
MLQVCRWENYFFVHKGEVLLIILANQSRFLFLFIDLTETFVMHLILLTYIEINNRIRK